MNTSKERKHGIALLVTLLMLGNTTMAGWAKSFHAGSGIQPQPRDGDWIASEAVTTRSADEAHISDLTLGHDAKMTEPTEEYDSDDTIFAEVEIAENEKTLKVKGRLHVIEVPGQNAGPIPALDLIVTVPAGKETVNFKWSNPTNGWPKGKYKFEALLIDASGKTIDTESHEFTVH